MSFSFQNGGKKNLEENINGDIVLCIYNYKHTGKRIYL